MTTILSLPTINLPASTAFFTALGFSPAEVNPAEQHQQQKQAVHLAHASLEITLHAHASFYQTVRNHLANTWYKRIHDGHHSLSHVTILPAPDAATADARCHAAVRAAGGRLDVLPPCTTAASYTRYIEDPDGRLWALRAELIAPPRIGAVELGVADPVELAAGSAALHAPAQPQYPGPMPMPTNAAGPAGAGSSHSSPRASLAPSVSSQPGASMSPPPGVVTRRPVPSMHSASSLPGSTPPPAYSPPPGGFAPRWA